MKCRKIIILHDNVDIIHIEMLDSVKHWYSDDTQPYSCTLICSNDMSIHVITMRTIVVVMTAVIILSKHTNHSGSAGNYNMDNLPLKDHVILVTGTLLFRCHWNLWMSLSVSLQMAADAQRDDGGVTWAWIDLHFSSVFHWRYQKQRLF